MSNYGLIIGKMEITTDESIYWAHIELKLYEILSSIHFFALYVSKFLCLNLEMKKEMHRRTNHRDTGQKEQKGQKGSRN